MNTKAILFLFIIVSQIFFFTHAQEAVIYDHSKIAQQSSFTLWGQIELRTKKDKNSPVAYRTLNHEGGMKISVLEILEKDTYKGEKGIWLFVQLKAPMWVDNGNWIERYRRFLIFLPDTAELCDFEE